MSGFASTFNVVEAPKFFDAFVAITKVSAAGVKTSVVTAPAAGMPCTVTSARANAATATPAVMRGRIRGDLPSMRRETTRRASLVERGSFGSGGWTRTTDTAIMSRLLYL